MYDAPLLLGKELTGMKIGMALLLTTVLSLVASAYAQPPSIDGTWHVTAVLTVTSVPNAYVKEGHMKEETWRVSQQADSATLTTPNGSVQGRFIPQTYEFPQGVWRFELAVPNFMGQPNLGAKFEVVILKRSANVLSGGSTVTYYSVNPYGGQWVPAGMESWRFDATRI